MVAGAAAFGVQLATDKDNEDRDSITTNALLSSFAGTAAGMLTAGNLNLQKLGLGDPFLSNRENNPWDNWLYGILVPGVVLVGAFTGHGRKNRTKDQRKTDLKRAGVLSAPVVGLSFLSNAFYTVPMYLSSLVGVMAARKYRKI